MSEDFLPQSRLCSTAEKAVHRLIRRKVMRKLTPLTAGLYNVQHGVCQFALAPLPIPHSRIQWLYFFPLAVCQVRRVRLAPCSYFFHAAIIPRFTYEDKLLRICKGMLLRFSMRLETLLLAMCMMLGVSPLGRMGLWQRRWGRSTRLGIAGMCLMRKRGCTICGVGTIIRSGGGLLMRISFYHAVCILIV